MALDPIQQAMLNSAQAAPLALGTGSPAGGLAIPGQLSNPLGAIGSGGAGYGSADPTFIGQATYAPSAASAASSSLPSALATPGSGAAASPADALLRQGYVAAPSVSPAAGGASGILAEAEGAAPAALGKWGNIVDKLPFGNPAEASLGGALGVGIGSQVLGGLVDKANFGGQNSNWDRGLTGAIKFGGIGGAGALALGLSGPVGWGIAGGAALLGAISGIAGGDHQSDADHVRTTYENVLGTSDKQGVLDRLGDTYGLNPTDMNNVKLSVQATMDLLAQNKDRAGMDAYVKNLATTLPQQLLQFKQARDADTQHFARVAAMQAQFAPLYSAIAGQSTQANATAYQNSVQAADQLSATNPQLGALIKANAGQSQAAQDGMLAAYASQIALGSANAAASSATPTAQQITQTQQSQAQLAALQQATAQSVFK